MFPSFDCNNYLIFLHQDSKKNTGNRIRVFFGQKTSLLRPRQLKLACYSKSKYLLLFWYRSKKKNISSTENVLGYQNNDWLSQDDSFENISMIVENPSSGETSQSWCGMSSTIDDNNINTL